MPTHPLGLAPLGFLDLAPPALVTLAAGAGFTAITVRARAAVPGGPQYPLDAGGSVARETARRLEATGLRIAQVELIGLDRHTDVESCRAMVAGGAALGAGSVVVSGDDDPAVVAERLSEVCALAAEHGMAVELEFMPFRRVRTIGDALAIIEMAGATNARVMVDALHLHRSGGTVEAVRRAPASRLGSLQLCDAPRAAPGTTDAALAAEARERRLLPGAGELPLVELVEAMPPGSAVAAEVPLPPPDADRAPEWRASAVAGACRTILAASRGLGAGRGSS
ncbi:MAG: TIM barrel protein [Ectothiorhodospiraceae bacterium]|nr:TIM barrel protein [Ectothiorhodospiraceae bacterium]